MNQEPIKVVHLKIEQQNGGVFVSSDQMPGLWLWGPDPERVFHDVIPAMENLYKHSHGVDVIACKRSGNSGFVTRFGLEEEPSTYEIYPREIMRTSPVHG